MRRVLFLLYFTLILQILQSNVVGENSIGHDLTSEPEWATMLRARIAQAVTERGYEEAKPHIRLMVEEVENSTNLLLHVKVSENGSSSVQFAPVQRARGHKKKGNHRILQDDPPWMEELKSFVKSIVQVFGKEKVQLMLQPTIKAIEEKYGVKILDVDRNVHVHYSPSPYPPYPPPPSVPER